MHRLLTDFLPCPAEYIKHDGINGDTHCVMNASYISLSGVGLRPHEIPMLLPPREIYYAFVTLRESGYSLES